jgi:hypothetical protein
MNDRRRFSAYATFTLQATLFEVKNCGCFFMRIVSLVSERPSHVSYRTSPGIVLSALQDRTVLVPLQKACFEQAEARSAPHSAVSGAVKAQPNGATLTILIAIAASCRSSVPCYSPEESYTVPGGDGASGYTEGGAGSRPQKIVRGLALLPISRSLGPQPPKQHP